MLEIVGTIILAPFAVIAAGLTIALAVGIVIGTVKAVRDQFKK